MGHRHSRCCASRLPGKLPCVSTRTILNRMLTLKRFRRGAPLRIANVPNPIARLGRVTLLGRATRLHCATRREPPRRSAIGCPSHGGGATESHPPPWRHGVPSVALSHVRRPASSRCFL